MKRGLHRLTAWLGLCCLLLSCGALPASAHEMTMAEMSVREVAPGQFIWSWGVPAKNRPIAEDLTPVWPQGCVADTQTVRCPDNGMVGTLSVDGVGKTYSAALVHIYWRSGQPRLYTITAAQPRVHLFGGASDERGATELATAYGVLGIQHILSGLDHLLFVISLLLLVGFRRRLVGTITAFTAAHSLTLVASALGWLTLRSPPVDAMIALSIVLVSAEALRDWDTLTRRWPALVAFLFGLVHGLGFAGALKEIGLPEQYVSIALLSFNVGVEIGQLLVVAAAWAAMLLLGRYAFVPATRRTALYLIGAMASFWSLTRMAAILS
jgi:hydrogenase/urease accessory protein HupE